MVVGDRNVGRVMNLILSQRRERGKRKKIYAVDDDLWGSIFDLASKTTSKPLNVIVAYTADDDDPWAAIGALSPTTRAKPLLVSQGRGTKPGASKLGVQRINQIPSSGYNLVTNNICKFFLLFFLW